MNKKIFKFTLLPNSESKNFNVKLIYIQDGIIIKKKFLGSELGIRGKYFFEILKNRIIKWKSVVLTQIFYFSIKTEDFYEDIKEDLDGLILQNLIIITNLIFKE
jgi:hypothetical protein